MQRAERHLTNYADGGTETIVLENADPNVDAGIDKFFHVTVQNLENRAISLALVPANFVTDRFTVDDGEVIRTFDSVEALNKAGYTVDAVLNDTLMVEKGDVQEPYLEDTVAICASDDPQRTIKQFLDHIKFNPEQLKHLEIVTSDENMWSRNFSITFCNPFFQNKVQRVNLNTYFSRFQYQGGRIGIDFKDHWLEFSDRLLFIVSIPSEATAQFLMTFA